MKSIFLLMVISHLLLQKANTRQQEKINFSNPAFISGSDFGRIFQRYYINGDVDKMMMLTSKSSIIKYGNKKIIAYYQIMNFGYKIKLKSLNHNHNLYQLNYETNINATQTIVRMTVIVENDTCRIILPPGFQKQQTFLFK